MNNKRCKQMRKSVRKHIPQAPVSSYKKINEKSKAFTLGGVLDAQGRSQTVVLNLSTCVLEKSCQRAVYQALKTAYKKGEL